MDRGTAVLLTAAVGGLIALQAPINSNLGRGLGTFQGAFVSFVIGTVALAVLAGLARGGFGTIGSIREVAPVNLLGGLLGEAYVTAALVTVRTLGAGGVTAATIAGQLTLSVVADHFGWLGVDRDPISLERVAGLALLAAGTYLVVHD